MPRARDGGTLVCDECGDRFRHPASLRRHQRRLHNRPSVVRRRTRDERGARRLEVAPLTRDEWDVPLRTGDDAWDEVIADNWGSIKTGHRTRPVVDIINIRTWRGTAAMAVGDYDAGEIL